jgi:hypothetical protein
MSYNSYIDVVFHSNATSTGNGIEKKVGNFKTLTIEIFGTSSSRTLTFNAKMKSGTIRAITGVRLSDMSTGTSTTGTGEIWQFDITGLESVIFPLTALAGGDLSVKGRMVT